MKVTTCEREEDLGPARQDHVWAMNQATAGGRSGRPAYPSGEGRQRLQSQHSQLSQGVRTSVRFSPASALHLNARQLHCCGT